MDNIKEFKVKVLENQIDKLPDRVVNKFCGSIYVIEPKQIESNKIKDNKVIREVGDFL